MAGIGLLLPSYLKVARLLLQLVAEPKSGAILGPLSLAKALTQLLQLPTFLWGSMIKASK